MRALLQKQGEILKQNKMYFCKRSQWDSFIDGSKDIVLLSQKIDLILPSMVHVIGHGHSLITSTSDEALDCGIYIDGALFEDSGNHSYGWGTYSISDMSN